MTTDQPNTPPLDRAAIQDEWLNRAVPGTPANGLHVLPREILGVIAALLAGSTAPTPSSSRSTSVQAVRDHLAEPATRALYGRSTASGDP